MKKLSKRDFLISSLAMSAVGLSGCSDSDFIGSPRSSNVHVIDQANASFLDRRTSPSGLDGLDACTRPNERYYRTLAEAGIDTVIRYFSDRNNAGLNCKNLTVRERDMLFDYGFSIAVVYQYNGNVAGRYTGARAQQDAAFILERAQVIRPPDGSTIYIGVDGDISKNSIRSVRAYFTEIRRILGGRFELGVYGPGVHCRSLKDAGLAQFFWVPEAPAWNGTREFIRSQDWTLYQNKTNVDRSSLTAGFGQEVIIDTNIINPKTTDTIGAFSSDNSIKTYDRSKLERVASSRLWVQSDRLDVFDRPGGNVVDRACIARTVHVLRIDGDWALVDLDEDGTAEGYCQVSNLLPLNDMPRWKRSVCSPPNI